MELDLLLEKVSPTSLGIAVAAILVTIAYYFLKSRGLPPGPTGLPFLGYWPFINNQTCHLQFEELKKKYGDVCSLTCTGTLYISLGTIKAAREAHITKADCFSQRLQDYNVMAYLFGGGIFFTDGEEWKTLRKFFIQVLKERLAIKNNKLQAMDESITSTLSYLKASKGETVNIVELLSDKSTSILRTTLFGDSDVTCEHIKEINKLYTAVIESMVPSNLLACGQIAKHILLPANEKYRNGVKNNLEIEKILYKMIDEHRSTFKEDNVRNIIDEFLKEKYEKRRKGDPAAKYFTDKALMASLLQFVGDGVIAVAALVGIVLRVLVDHPEEQEKIYQEILEVCGSDRQPTMEDKSKLVYLNAFVLESLRTSEFILFFPSLECTKETTINGYRIPKGAVTLLNMWSAHYDSNTYEEPQKFNPSRFLNRDGKRKEDPPITFGVGKRSCMGEGFSMTQTYLFFASIIRNFHIKLPDDNSKNSLEDWMAGKLFISAVPRKQ